ncbi:MAG: hypothetical protein ACRDVW_02455, partial [Acidimicrobiales bacterium]
MSADALEPVGPGDGFDLELAVSSLASNSTDVHLMLRLLASELAGALGSRLAVERPGGFRRRTEEI